MHTRLLLGIVGAGMWAIGLGATFLPQEILTFHGTAPDRGSVLAVQVAGALYLSLGMMNWMWRANLVGGIYGKPVAVANLMYFTVTALTFVRTAGNPVGYPMLVAAALHGVFAVWFGLLVYGRSPSPDRAR